VWRFKSESKHYKQISVVVNRPKRHAHKQKYDSVVFQVTKIGIGTQPEDKEEKKIQFPLQLVQNADKIRFMQLSTGTFQAKFNFEIEVEEH
jgi:hypothetical protein